MIRKVFALVPEADRGLIPRYWIAIVLHCIGQAGAFVLAAPALTALFEGRPEGAWPWIGAMTAFVALAGVTYYLQSMIGFRIGIDMSRDLQMRLGDQLNRIPLGWFSAERAGSVGQVITVNVKGATGVFAHLLLPVMTGILVPALVAVGTLAIDWRVSLAMVVAAPILYAVNRWGTAVFSRADRDADAAAIEANSAVIEFAQAQPVLRAFGALRRGDSRLDGALLAQRTANRRLVWSTVPGTLVFAFAAELAFVGLIYVVVGLALGGQLEPASAVALFAVTSRFVEPLTRAADMANAIRAAGNAADKITAVLDERPLPSREDGPTPEGSGVVFDDIRFGYADGEPVIDSISLAAEPGTTLALVGPSGSGKTTLLRLAARFFDVDRGRILVGGHDVRDYRPETLFAQVSVVFQDVYLFEGTVADNIRLGRPDATDEQVEAAARAARVDEIVDRLPGGWDAQVGEGGASLSGGERQRISVARALLKDAPVVLLDEATSALDPVNEAALVQALRELTRDKTVIVVAHRLSTIQHADRIAFLQDGAIVESGTHRELLALGGRYADFWRERESATGWRLAPAG